EIGLKERDMGIELRRKAKKILAERGFDPVLGARALRRTIQRDVEDQLSETILFGDLEPGQIVVVDAEGEGTGSTFSFKGVPKPTDVPDTPKVEESAATKSE